MEHWFNVVDSLNYYFFHISDSLPLICGHTLHHKRTNIILIYCPRIIDHVPLIYEFDVILPMYIVIRRNACHIIMQMVETYTYGCSSSWNPNNALTQCNIEQMCEYALLRYKGVDQRGYSTWCSNVLLALGGGKVGLTVPVHALSRGRGRWWSDGWQPRIVEAQEQKEKTTMVLIYFYFENKWLLWAYCTQL